MINRFGVIPKGSTGKWCTIVDLSYLEGGSVNDGMQAEWHNRGKHFSANYLRC